MFKSQCISVLCCPVNMLDQRKYFGRMKKTYFLIIFVIFFYLVPEFKKPVGITIKVDFV